MEDVFIIIPAYQPELSLCGYVENLKNRIQACIVVIDDGSDENSSAVFSSLSKVKSCTILHHSTNRGKGRALKTGFCYVKNRCKADCRIVTVDCDGQHRAEDVVMVLQKLSENPGTFVLGERDFSVEGVPFRSKFGNSTVSLLFWLSCGKWLKDTQTGLRAFDRTLLNMMIDVPGEKYDYEMRVLTLCARKKIKICTVDIATIYEEGNKGSHFRPVADSLSVLRTLFGDFVKFGMSSLFCAGLDIFLFWIITELIPQNIFSPDYYRITAATLTARLVSAGVNFLINRGLVFSSQDPLSSLVRYMILCAAVSGVSAFFVTVLSSFLPFSLTGVKILCDTALFLLSYFFQKFWVFRKDTDK